MGDREAVAAQLERQPRSPVEVVARCHLGMPVVIAVPPHLDDGTPFPTHYWLTCPLAIRRIGRTESVGGVKAAEQRLASDPASHESFMQSMLRYAAARHALIADGATGPMPSGGVGGAARGVKCLHAHYADHAAGNHNVVGEWTAVDVEPLNCDVPCVVESGGDTVRNPSWREPKR